MNKDQETTQITELFQAFLQFKNYEELSRFCRDLFTTSEIKELARRFQAARLLKNKTSYTKIALNTGLSSATIAKISARLKKGLGGYKLAIKRLEEPENKKNSYYLKRK